MVTILEHCHPIPLSLLSSMLSRFEDSQLVFNLYSNQVCMLRKIKTRTAELGTSSALSSVLIFAPGHHIQKLLS